MDSRGVVIDSEREAEIDGLTDFIAVQFFGTCTGAVDITLHGCLLHSTPS